MPPIEKRADPLDNPVREEMLEVATRCPGLAIVDLARRLQVHRSTVSHHLGVLESAGLVSLVRVGRTSLVNPARGSLRPIGDFLRRPVPADLAAGLNHHVRRALVLFLSRHGPACYYKYVAWAMVTRRRHVLVARDTFRHHCNRLKKAGWLESARESRRTVWNLRPETKEMIQSMDPGFLEDEETASDRRP